MMQTRTWCGLIGLMVAALVFTGSRGYAGQLVWQDNLNTAINEENDTEGSIIHDSWTEDLEYSPERYERGRYSNSLNTNNDYDYTSDSTPYAQNQVVFIKFPLDLAASLGPDKNVTHAELLMHCNSSSPDSGAIRKVIAYPIIQPWDYRQVSWHNTTEWDNALAPWNQGATFADQCFNMTPATSFSADATVYDFTSNYDASTVVYSVGVDTNGDLNEDIDSGEIVSFDVTEFVKLWYLGQVQNNGWVIIAPNAGTRVRLWSSNGHYMEGPVYYFIRPVLTIDYENLSPATAIVVNPSSMTVDEGASAGVPLQVSLNGTGTGQCSLTATGDVRLNTTDTATGAVAALNVTMSGIVPVTVYVFGRDDPDYTNESETITLAYGGLPNENVNVTITDDDVPATAIVVNPTIINIDENNSPGVQLTIALNGDGTGTCTMVSSSATDVVISPTDNVVNGLGTQAQAMNNEAQFTFYVFAVDDADQTNETVTITVSYPGFSDVVVTVNVTDDDALNILAVQGATTIDEDATDGVSLDVRLSQPGYSGTLAVTSTNSYIRFGTAANNPGAAQASINVPVDGTTVQQTIYVYYVDDGNQTNENGVIVRITDGGGIGCQNSPLDVTFDIRDDEIANYDVSMVNNTAWEPVDGLTVSTDQTVIEHLQVQLTNDPSSPPAYVTTTAAGDVEVSLDGASYSASVQMQFSTGGVPQNLYVRATTGAAEGVGSITLSGLSGVSDLVIDVNVVQTYSVSGSITMTGSLTDTTQVTATLYDSGTDQAVANVSAATLDASGNYTITGVPPGTYYVMFTSTNYNIYLQGSTTPAKTSAFNVSTGNVTVPGTLAVESKGKTHKGGGGGCSLDSTRNAAAAGAFLAALLLAVGLRRKN